MSDGPAITSRERRILVAAAAKLTTSSTVGEREVIFQRINAELDRLRIGWADLFDKALPHPEEAHRAPGVMESAGHMMAGFGDMMQETRRQGAAPPLHRAHRRRLSGDEIPRTISGTVSVVDEREWRGGMMMTVNVSSSEFTYGPLMIFQQASQDVVRDAGRRTVTGRVKQPHGTSNTPTLDDLMID